LQRQVEERGRSKTCHRAAEPKPHTGARLGTWHCRRGRHLYHQPNTPPHAACSREPRSHHAVLENAHFLVLDRNRTNRKAKSLRALFAPFSSPLFLTNLVLVSLLVLAPF